MRRALFCTDSIASSKYFGRAAQTGQAYSSSDLTMLQFPCTSCMIVRPLFLSARNACKRLLAFLTMCISDPPEVVSQESSVALYADDCKAFRVVNCPNDLMMFQDELDKTVKSLNPGVISKVG